ncbi:MAG: hypothetical protein Q4B58_08900, partial [Bacteroidales bacterium]|nr:hypothetical protein [Bacteroidales bacterium]
TFLNNVGKLLRRTKGGKDSDLYFKVSEYSYKLAPTQESAKGMSDLAIRNKDWDNAVKYLDESLGFAVQPEDKADILCMQGYVYYKFKNNYSKARELCRQAAALDKTNAESHMYIGEMYMQSGKMVFPNEDGVVQRLVFIAAADEFAKGKAADPSRAADFNTRIAQCKQQYPEKSQLFMKGIKGSYHIPGWMNVNVSIPD